jgi:hypothetical protein
VHFFADFNDERDARPSIVPHTPTLDVSEWIREGERDARRRSCADSDIADLPDPRAH